MMASIIETIGMANANLKSMYDAAGPLSSRFESLVCIRCRKACPLETLSRCPSCNGVLETRYTLGGEFPTVYQRKSIWDFAEFLPPVRRENIVSLGEGWTSYMEAPNLAERMGVDSVMCKVEGSNPTGSFKDRAASVGVSLARQWGKRGIFTASDGNAGASASAYAAAARMRCLIMVGEDVPASKVSQIAMYTPSVLRVGELYKSRSSLESALAQAAKSLPDWMNLFMWAPYNPLMVDAVKTMAYEIALSEAVPDFVFVPTTGGDLLYGLYKGFRELREMGILERVPGLIAVQGEGADPTVQAIEKGLDTVPETGPPTTIAGALRVNFGGEHALRAVRETGGFGVSVPNDSIVSAQKELARLEGIFCEISSAAGVAAIKIAADKGSVTRDQSVAAILTGFGLKDYLTSERESPQVPFVPPSELDFALRAFINQL